MGTDLVLWIKEERGVTSVVVALLVVILVGVAALAIDTGHLFVVRNELQNASDAGCLAGGRFLYREDGTAVNEDANQVAYDAAIVNRSDGSPVEVQWSGGNGEDVERGHWSFMTRTFTPNGSTQTINLWDVSPEELDANPNFINAIRVRTRRQETPAVSLFAGILGYNSFSLATEAIAYTGFAGTMAPEEVDQPVAICKESLLVNGRYSCAIGRVISIGEEVAVEETGGWTDLNQDNPCLSGTNALTVATLVTRGGNPNPIIFSQPIATNAGDIPLAFILLRERWEFVTGRTRPWTITLPVIECPGNDLGSCGRMVGAVAINIVWITGGAEDPTYSDAPWVMEDPRTGIPWVSNDPDGQLRWDSFVQSFNLTNLDGSFVPYQKKAIYFMPDCNHQILRGRTGGENFGILAKIPVLAR